MTLSWLTTVLPPTFLDSLSPATQLPNVILPFNTQPSWPAPMVGNCSLYDLECVTNSTGITSVRPGFTQRHKRKRKRKRKKSAAPYGVKSKISRIASMKKNGYESDHHDRYSDTLETTFLPSRPSSSATPLYDTAYYPLFAVLLPSLRPEYGRNILEPGNTLQYSQLESGRKPINTWKEHTGFNARKQSNLRVRYIDDEIIDESIRASINRELDSSKGTIYKIASEEGNTEISGVHIYSQNEINISSVDIFLPDKDTVKIPVIYFTGALPTVQNNQLLRHGNIKTDPSQSPYTGLFSGYPTDKVTNKTEINESQFGDSVEYKRPRPRISDSQRSLGDILHYTPSFEHPKKFVKYEYSPHTNVLDEQMGQRRQLSTVKKPPFASIKKDSIERDTNQNDNRLQFYKEKISSERENNNVMRQQDEEIRDIQHQNEIHEHKQAQSKEQKNQGQLHLLRNQERKEKDDSRRNPAKSGRNEITLTSSSETLTEEEEEELIRQRVREEQITIPQKNQQDVDVKTKIGTRLKNNDDQDQDEDRKEWDRLGQLIIVVMLAALGTIGNIFAIAAVITESTLRKAGNILLANLMVACLLVTACVLPAGVVELLAGWADPSPACKPTWALTILAAHAALITLPCLAWENHARHYSPRPLPGCVLVAMIIASWCAAFSLMAAQWAGGYGPTHCEAATAMTHHDSVTGGVGVPLVVIPLLIMIILHMHTLLRTPISSNASTRISDHDRASPDAVVSPKKNEPPRDLALVGTNLIVGLITGGLWAGGVAIDWWGSSEGRLNWLPSVAAASCGFLYAAHRPFRDAYYQLFNYCCCKTTVSMARRGRNEPPMELYSSYNASTSRTSTEHVRVHIIPPYNMYSQQCPRPPQPCSTKPSRPKERRHKPSLNEIYEL